MTRKCLTKLFLQNFHGDGGVLTLNECGVSTFDTTTQFLPCIVSIWKHSTLWKNLELVMDSTGDTSLGHVYASNDNK